MVVLFVSFAKTSSFFNLAPQVNNLEYGMNP